MGALALVSKFQERLEVSKANAIWRVIGLLIILACAVAVVMVAAIGFPYASSFTDEIPLLPGNHIQVSKILDGEVLVSKAQFLQTAVGNMTFISLEKHQEQYTIVYMAKVAGVSYRYEQDAPVRYNYVVPNQQIQNGRLIREIDRNTAGMIWTNILLPIFALFVLFIFFVCVETRKISYDREAHVWF